MKLCYFRSEKNVTYIKGKFSRRIQIHLLFYGAFMVMASQTIAGISKQIFKRWELQAHAQPPTCRDRVSVFLRHLTQNLFDMCGPISSQAVGSITSSSSLNGGRSQRRKQHLNFTKLQ
jgi:hypothetical protein